MIDGVSNWYFGAFRYLPNGELNQSFGEGGWVDTDLGSFEFPHAVALQPDGGIVVAGEGDCRFAGCFVLARYRPDGSLDPGFGEGGVVHTPFGFVHGARAFDVSIAPDGRVVAAGFVQMGGDGQDSSHFAVARYLPDGRLDQSFSRDGRAYSDSSQDASDWMLLRYGRGGRLDSSFGGDGVVVMDFGTGEDSVRALALRDGRILAAGSIYSSLALARYLP